MSASYQHPVQEIHWQLWPFITFVDGLVRPSWFCSPHLQSGFSTQMDRSSEKTKSEAPLELGLKRCLISTQGLHTFMVHMGKNQKTHTHTHTLMHYCFWHQHLQSPSNTHLFTHSFTHSKLPPPFPFFLAVHITWFKSCTSGLLDQSTKALLMHPGEAPLERPPFHPGWN